MFRSAAGIPIEIVDRATSMRGTGPAAYPGIKGCSERVHTARPPCYDDSTSPPVPAMRRLTLLLLILWMPPALAEPSRGCEADSPMPSGEHWLAVGDLSRRYLLDLPTPGCPYPCRARACTARIYRKSRDHWRSDKPGPCRSCERERLRVGAPSINILRHHAQCSNRQSHGLHQ